MFHYAPIFSSAHSADVYPARTIAIGIDFSKDLLGPYHLYIGFGYLYTTTAKLKEMLFLIIKVFAAVNALQMMTLSTPASEIITVMKRAHVPK
jgi:cobalt/nickel transport system permease protein